MNKEKTLPVGITQAMIDLAIEKHGQANVRYIEIMNEDGNAVELTVLAIVPTRTVLGQYRKFADNEPKRADEILVKACLLSHKDEVLADDGLFTAALTGIADLIPVRKAIVKNL